MRSWNSWTTGCSSCGFSSTRRTMPPTHSRWALWSAGDHLAGLDSQYASYCLIRWVGPGFVPVRGTPLEGLTENGQLEEERKHQDEETHFRGLLTTGMKAKSTLSGRSIVLRARYLCPQSSMLSLSPLSMMTQSYRYAVILDPSILRRQAFPLVPEPRQAFADPKITYSSP